jgi:hypothetical protein
LAASTELGLPLVTDRQRSLKAEFRRIASELGVVVGESNASDGTQFLDIELEPNASVAAAIVQHFLARFYGVQPGTPLQFLVHGCQPQRPTIACRRRARVHVFVISRLPRMRARA